MSSVNSVLLSESSYTLSSLWLAGTLSRSFCHIALCLIAQIASIDFFVVLFLTQRADYTVPLQDCLSPVFESVV